MARAPNPGAPQRVSAHVVPKAASFPNEDEEERTAIETGAWEEEVSTTVEQGEVAAKLRALAIGGDGRRPNTNVTATHGSGVTEDPTVDDQRAGGLAALSPPGSARLIVTHGNDTGRSLEVRPGKEYTVGRGIENDLVLTDITASRKHFDLRFEGASWVLADRGSGNGTLINNRIEDAPFVLATGDTIEVGNTAFRFELFGPSPSRGGVGRDGAGRPGRLPTDESAPHDPPSPSVAVPPPVGLPPVMMRDQAGAPLAEAAGLPRERPGAHAGYDDVEPSTVSASPSVDLARSSAMRSSAMPAQMRSRSSSVRPGAAAAPERPGAGPAAGPIATAIPAIAPLQTGPLGPQPATAVTPPLAAGRSSALVDPAHGPLPATLPGPGPGAPVPGARSGRLPFGFGAASDQNAQLVSGIRPPLNVAPGNPPRDATSTALVQPISYSDGPAPPPPPPAYRMIPPLSRRVLLGAVALAVFATVATVAIIKSLSSDVPALDRTVASTPAPSWPSTSAASPSSREPEVPPRPRPAVVAASPPAAAPREPHDRAAGSAAAAVIAPRTGAEHGSGSGAADAPSNVRRDAAPATASTSPTRTPSSPGGAPVPPSQVASAVTPRPASPASGAAKPSPAATPPAPAVRPAAPPARPITPPRAPVVDRRPVKRIEPRPVPRKAEPPVVARADKKRGRGMQEVKSEASALYRSKNFSGAAQSLTSSSSGFTGEDAKELKNLASIYTQLGKNYSIGMAPGTKATDAYVALNRALDFDKDVGAVFVAEIKEKLAATASRAAALYMASKEYEQAFQAVRVAEQLRSSSPTNKVVRESLANVAEELLRGARAEQSSNREGARQKLRQVLGIVEPRSATYAQAQKLLSAL